MLTNDKNITTPEYWNKIYEGKNDNAKVDASNTTRPANPFDRFTWVAQLAEGPNVLEVAAGHAHISKRIKQAHPDWAVYASDQAESAKKVARYLPYYIFSAYEIPYPDKFFTTIIATQCLEYMDDLTKFFNEAKRVAEYLIFTVPLGEMSKWSQLRIFTFKTLSRLFTEEKAFAGAVLETWVAEGGEIFMGKIKFNA